ncbi:LYR motif-containing protein [Bacillus cereus]|uniref:LYR motif-containing protein n=1 Tax=Bacillus cereus TaxID=1396 RepID=UPI0018F4E922|nr:LYR motif-containing protein [Bacillus cereus]MBJ7985825.1 LYR motif-containing protein [Bacillus cereus]
MYLVNIFYDVNGNFQWVSMTALAALIVGIVGPSISIYNNKKTLEKQEHMNISNFKGNVVAKARIEWIQEVRQNSVEFISAFYNLFEFIKASDDIKWLDAEGKKEFSRLKTEIEKNGAMLILYFGPDSNKNNELIVYLVNSLINPLTNKYGDYMHSTIVLVDKVEVLKKFLRIYLKAEWKRANGEIMDSEVQTYLEQHKIYVDIISAFGDQMRQEEEWERHFYGEHLQKKYKVSKP